MNADMKRKQELEAAMKEYFDQAEIRPWSDPFTLAHEGDYVTVFGSYIFYKDDEPEDYSLLAPTVAERKLNDRINSIFDSQVSPETVRNSRQKAFESIKLDTTFKLPFTTDEQEQLYLDRLYEELNFHYGRRYYAIVPLYQVECANGVKFPLANAFLYSGDTQSRLAAIVNHEPNRINRDDIQQIESCSYLKFPVTGDANSRLKQVEHEAERALQVLRFITPWYSDENKTYNPAHGVSTWKQFSRIIAYERTSSNDNRALLHREIPNGINAGHELSAEILRYAKEVCGLDDINYHFQTSATNRVSERICRSLRFYDTAAQSSVAQVAFSNFVISVDILLPGSNKSRLTQFLRTLVEHGGFYTGEMNLDEESKYPEATSWPKRVQLTTKDFENHYRIRSDILHGNQQFSIGFAARDLRKVRQIAHNAIRAYAYLARAFGWETDKQAKAWFKCPHSPPREAES